MNLFEVQNESITTQLDLNENNLTDTLDNK